MTDIKGIPPETDVERTLQIDGLAEALAVVEQGFPAVACDQHVTVTSGLVRAHTVTVEPLTDELRAKARANGDTSEADRFAVVERFEGRVVKVCATAADVDQADEFAALFARAYGAVVRSMTGVPTDCETGWE
jgi:hypothetical protein